MRISPTSPPLSANRAGLPAQVWSSGSGSLQKVCSSNNDRCDKKRHLEIDEETLSEICSESDGRDGPGVQSIPPNSSKKLEKKLQDYVTKGIEHDSSPSSVSSNFVSGNTFWMKFLDESQSQVSGDTGEQRKGTPMGYEIRHTWSSGSPLSECSAFNDFEEASSGPLMNSSKPTESHTSRRQGSDRESRTDPSCRNDENSGHRRGSTGGPRDQPSPLLVPRRSVLTPDSSRMTPTGRYFGDVTNRIDHRSPSPAPNSQSKAKSKVAELAEKFQKGSVGGKTIAPPPAQVLVPSDDIGSRTEMDNAKIETTALRVMTSCTPIPNSSNARLAKSPLPDPVIEMGGMLHTPVSQSSMTSELHVTPQASQKQSNDPSTKQMLPSENPKSTPGVQSMVSIFSSSTPTPTPLQSEEKETNIARERDLDPPEKQVLPKEHRSSTSGVRAMVSMFSASTPTPTHLQSEDNALSTSGERDPDLPEKQSLPKEHRNSTSGVQSMVSIFSSPMPMAGPSQSAEKEMTPSRQIDCNAPGHELLPKGHQNSTSGVLSMVSTFGGLTAQLQNDENEIGTSSQYDPNLREQQVLPKEHRKSTSGVRAMVSLFSASSPPPTQIQGAEQKACTSSENDPKEEELCAPPSQVVAVENALETHSSMSNPVESTLPTATGIGEESTENNSAQESVEPKHTLMIADASSGTSPQELNIIPQAIVRPDGSGGFKHLLRQWRDKSDDKPNAHFLSPEQESRPDTRNMSSGFSPQVSRLQLEDDRNRSTSQAETPLVTKRIKTYNKDYFDVVRENLGPENQKAKPVGPSNSSLQTKSKFRRSDDADSPPQVPKVNAFYENSQLVCKPASSSGPKRALSTDDNSQAIVILKNKDNVKVLFGEAQNDASEQVVVRNVEMITSTEQESYTGEPQTCECSSSIFSGNDDLISFFLPQMGMACTCGRQARQFVDAEDPTSIENILRPWQVEFLKSFGIHRGDQLVKARHRSAGLLAKALRQWRKKKGMMPFKTSACGMAIHIWAKTCKAFVRSIRKHTAAGTLRLDQQPAELAQEFSNFLGALPNAPNREAEHLMLAIEPDSQVEV